MQPNTDIIRESHPLWYKDAIVYELHVRAFQDSNADGIGDFPGLTQKLDYLQDLGVTALWLLPFYPSPLKDDGYDIADYFSVHPAYGTLDDFKHFLDEAHRRGLYVITELVINHTSDQHPWFQRARRAEAGSSWRNFYVWSDTPEKYKDARIIFKDFETSNWAWDPIAKAYYWHRFYSHQPDLNYDNPDVHQAVYEALDFWLGMGVDGLRLDAVPYLYEREGTNCENLPETHAFLRELRRHVDMKFQDRMLLAEANQWPEDAAAYFGQGDECHMNFHFPVMPRLFMGVRLEDRFPIVEIMQQTPSIPDNCQWALFLRNHDELTLEMVTDEDRDYMYRVYARDPQARINLGIRRRLAPLLENGHRRMELMNALLFSLPGTPIIYYGDEIGMGDNVYLGDRNGVRTPMQWNADRNAGFSRANPQRLYLPVIIDPEYRYEAVNVEAQQNNLHSRLWWMKRLIALRKRYSAFGRGTLEFLQPDNHKVLAFVRSYQDERILVVANLSRFVQGVELDLSSYQGLVLSELFGRTKFPVIGAQHYFLSLGPHAFYWFALEPQRVERPSLADQAKGLPAVSVVGSWENVFQGTAKRELERILPDYLRTRRWFGGKARSIQSTEILETIPMSDGASAVYVTLVQVAYVEGDPETYVLPLAFTSGKAAATMQAEMPQSIVAQLSSKDGCSEGVLYDALFDKNFATTLLNAISHERNFKGATSAVISSVTQSSARLAEPLVEATLQQSDQTNTSVVYGDRFILKLFRRADEGVNPELEIGRFLTHKAFAHIPPVVGALEYVTKNHEPVTLAILQRFVPSQGNAWDYTLNSLGRFFERALARRAEVQSLLVLHKPLQVLLADNISEPDPELFGAYAESARLLGQRTGELHVALSSDTSEPAFAPEPFTAQYQRSLSQSMRSLSHQVFRLLRQHVNRLPEAERLNAQQLLASEDQLRARCSPVLEHKIDTMRIRCHGDYHLGQVLYTGNDFVIIDFEGEPARPISQRRLKRSPLSDVAGMIRSFHYATRAAMRSAVVRAEDIPTLEPWADSWYQWISALFLKAYLNTVTPAGIVPKSKADLGVLLDVYLMSKALYELGYELNNRPELVNIPLQGLLQILDVAKVGEGVVQESNA